MPPKKAKKGKGLTRGRVRNPKVSSTTSASDVSDLEELADVDVDDDTSRKDSDTSESSEDPVRGSASSLVSSKSGKSGKNKYSSSSAAASVNGDVANKKIKNRKNTETEVEEVEEDEEEEEIDIEEDMIDIDVPDLVAELRGNRGTAITYITDDVRHRQFELNARKQLLRMQNELDMMSDTLMSSLKIARNLCPDSQRGRIAEAIKTLGFPKTFKDLIVRLLQQQTGSKMPIPGMGDLILEESGEEDNSGNLPPPPPSTSKGIPRKVKIHATPGIGSATSKSKTPKPNFPSPGRMAKFQTPKQNGIGGVFHFGQNSRHKGVLSSSKAPRIAKPGEIVYSERGSPIFQRRVPDDVGHVKTERVQILGEDGSAIEVDMVYRGVQDANKLRGFKEFAKDVRGLATSRSTVKQNRVQPPRIKLAAKALSATKKKPEWR